MSKKLNAVIWIIVLISTAALYGDIKHASDPRGKIENITGEGEFVWEIDKQEVADWVKEGTETERNVTIREVRWTVKGGGQNWTFTRITRMGTENEDTIKRERFWVNIIKLDGEWVTRTKYRHRGGTYKEGDTDEVSEKDKGSKYKARCRITGKKVILAIFKKKQGYIFSITKKDGLVKVNFIATHDLRNWTMSYKKQ
ncbi:MAG: hypothetical protein GY940_16265 [bacterium]|nr:hypothetical protein [bacterium]